MAKQKSRQVQTQTHEHGVQPKKNQMKTKRKNKNNLKGKAEKIQKQNAHKRRVRACKTNKNNFTVYARQAPTYVLRLNIHTIVYLLYLLTRGSKINPRKDSVDFAKSGFHICLHL